MIASASQIWVQGNENSVFYLYLFIMAYPHLSTSAVLNHEWAHWRAESDVSTHGNERYTYGLVNL